MKNKEIGIYLHQLLNHATKNKNIAHICRQMGSNILVGLNKLCVAIGQKVVKHFADRKIIESQRLLDLMRINELVSRLNEESISIVADSLEQQLNPILDAEFNDKQKKIEYGN
jgi:hypothetical protein